MRPHPDQINLWLPFQVIYFHISVRERDRLTALDGPRDRLSIREISPPTKHCSVQPPQNAHGHCLWEVYFIYIFKICN